MLYYIFAVYNSYSYCDRATQSAHNIHARTTLG